MKLYGKGKVHVGSILSAARANKGWSQTQLEVLTGLPKSRISRYEHDHIEPSLTTLSRLTTALGINVVVASDGKVYEVDDLTDEGDSS